MPLKVEETPNLDDSRTASAVSACRYALVGDAAAVQTGAAQSVAVDEGDLHAQLRSAWAVA